MSRDVPFYPEQPCDVCGKQGAWDFMGDCLCPECSEKFVGEAEEGPSLTMGKLNKRDPETTRLKQRIEELEKELYAIGPEQIYKTLEEKTIRIAELEEQLRKIIELYQG